MNPKKLITFLFSLLAEGYTTENASDKEGMMVILKTGRWITAKDIGNTLNDIDAISAIQFYQPATTYVPTREVIDLYVSADKRMNISIMQDGDETVLNKYNNLTSTNPIIVSRLAEMYLISAEGKGLSGGGLERLNQLRNKRGLPDVSPKTEEEFLDAILAERRLEFLGEGFRWFDLVRTGKLQETLGMAEKYNVFPIPQDQIDLNPNLKQNDLWK